MHFTWKTGFGVAILEYNVHVSNFISCKQVGSWCEYKFAMKTKNSLKNM